MSFNGFERLLSKVNKGGARVGKGKERKMGHTPGPWEINEFGEIEAKGCILGQVYGSTLTLIKQAISSIEGK